MLQKIATVAFLAVILANLALILGIVLGALRVVTTTVAGVTL